MFVALGCLVEIQSRRRLIGLCLGSAIVISGFIWFGSPDLETYRGLSGIDTALFVSVAISIAATAVAQQQWARALISGLLFLASPENCCSKRSPAPPCLSIRMRLVSWSWSRHICWEPW